MTEMKPEYKPIEGKTYSLFGDEGSTERYYADVRRLTDKFLERCPSEKRLLSIVRKASGDSLLKKIFGEKGDRELIGFMRDELERVLSGYTRNVRRHLSGLSVTKRFDEIIAAKEFQYHYYMVEIELVNRIYKEGFKSSDYRFALIAHCLRDFRPGCDAAPGDIEAVCKACTEDCYINLGSVLMKEYGIDPYISVEMEQEGLFKKIMSEHKRVGALGIACVPELARGMRLCIRLGISPVGIPLDANRCARWMGEAREGSYNMEELEALLR